SSPNVARHPERRTVPLDRALPLPEGQGETLALRPPPPTPSPPWRAPPTPFITTPSASGGDARTKEASDKGFVFVAAALALAAVLGIVFLVVARRSNPKPEVRVEEPPPTFVPISPPPSPLQPTTDPPPISVPTIDSSEATAVAPPASQTVHHTPPTTTRHP